MIFRHIQNGETKDITSLIIRATWSGDIREVARKLELSIAVSPSDEKLPRVIIDMADMIMMYDDQEQELFQGYVFKKQKSYNGNELSMTAYDGLIYLVKSKLSKTFRNVTPEAITRSVCDQLGVPVGELAATGIPISFVHMGKTGYEAIITAYTEAHKKNGKQYMPRMNKGKLDVIEKGDIVVKVKLSSDRNLTNATYAEDIESMVNQVIITDDKGNRVGVLTRDAWVKNYGLLQEVYQKESEKKGSSKENNNSSLTIGDY
ncbi:XkdQ/YqbQ family protein [Paenibacillus elgii]|uniref:XkdQ/YqbQ family protein n=1 Tax=Paenibacillus elgii TaxID=189691 RepID=UPI000248D3DB|nr:hypothetical protein [Paenibacillus elgii]